jgi:hypothetical protein
MAENTRNKAPDLLGRKDQQSVDDGPGPAAPPPRRLTTSRPHDNFRPLRLVLHGSGYSVELDRPDMVLGRHSGCDVRLPLPDVSRRHCRFTYNGGEWTVYDLQSLNGVYVNGERVTVSLVKAGDRLGIGGFKFEVGLGESVPAVDAKVTDAAHPILGMLRPPGSQESGRRKAS